jgi:hypothetical protein
MIPQHSLDTSRGHSVVLFQKQQDAALSVCPVDGRCHRARSWMSRRLNFRRAGRSHLADWEVRRVGASPNLFASVGIFVPSNRKLEEGARPRETDGE